MSQLFKGFTPETYGFFLMIGMNNNKPFFDENKALYEQQVKQPLHALAADMEEFMRGIDPGIETRPAKCISRIRRSSRYQKDKSLYRDHLWISWRDREMDEENGRLFSFYFSISHSYMDCGGGYYMAKPSDMAHLRKKIARFPREFQKIITTPGMKALNLFGEDYKRLPDMPEDLPEDCKRFYTKRSFYLEKPLPIDEKHSSPELVGILKETYGAMKPFYDFLTKE